MKTLTLALLLGSIMAASLRAQASECTYDRCALRLQYRGSRVRVVQGTEATRIARIGLFPPRIDLLASADDSTRVHYEAFRQRHSRAARLGLVALGAAVAGSALLSGSDNEALEWTGVGLMVVGVGFSLASSSNGGKGRDELSQAIWFYNRRFTAP